MTLEHIHIHGTRIEYAIIGEGVPLVFLHGMGGSIRQIQSTCEPLPGIRLIVPNQQGHGNSEADWPDYSFDRLADDIIALLDALKLDRVYLAGISMGAAICLNLAIRYPDRAIAMLLIRNAWTDSPMSLPVQQAYRDLGQSLCRGGLDAFKTTPGWDIVQAESSDYTLNAFTSPFQDESCLRAWQKYLILPALSPAPDKNTIRNLRIPTVILANRDDLCHPFAYGKYLADLIPGASLTEIPSKDADPQTHKAMINQALRQMIPTESK